MTFNYCYRYMSEYDSKYSIGLLPDSLYTPKLIEHCKKILANPTYTQEEAEVIAMSFQPQYSVSDTTGFTALQHKKDSLYINYRGYNRSLHGEEKDLYFKKYTMINNAKDRGITLKQYCDSLNEDLYEWRVKQYVGKELYDISSILSGFASNKVYRMAPLIEEYGKQYFSDIKIQKMLARLNYKDYHERQTTYDAQQVIYYTQQIDSLSQILSPIDHLLYFKSSNKIKGWEEYETLLRIFNRLNSIGTQEAYFAMAPLLLINNQVRDYKYSEGTAYIECSIATEFYERIGELLSGVPLPSCMKGDYYRLRDLYTSGECRKEIEAYIPKVYQWMIDNKGKFKLKNPQND